MFYILSYAFFFFLSCLLEYYNNLKINLSNYFFRLNEDHLLNAVEQRVRMVLQVSGILVTKYTNYSYINVYYTVYKNILGLETWNENWKYRSLQQ